MRVVVLGAGYAGLTLTRELEQRLPGDVELRIVDETGTHLVQHELHRLVRRPSLVDEIELPLADVLDDAEITRARVDDVDPRDRSITLDGGQRIEYDVGVLSLGADPDFYGLPGLAEHATPLKRIEHARAIREGVEPVIEDGGRIVVGGAGLSGIQVAGELAEMARGGPSDVSVLLLEQRETIAPGFDENFQTAVREALEKRDVAIWTDAKIERADAEAVTLVGGQSIACDELIWTGGIRGDDAMDRERPVIRSDLRLDDRTFAIGDAVRVVDDHGERVPASARTAIGQARVAAANVEAVLDHTRAADGSFSPRLDRYSQGRPRWLVSVGDGAVAQIGNAVVTGRAALALKTSVGAGYLGRVGPIQKAVDLVWSELGLGEGDNTGADASENSVDDDASGRLGGTDAGERTGDTDDSDGDGATDPVTEEYDRLPDSVVEELTEE